MGALQRQHDGQIFYLPYQLVIGRSESSDLVLPVPSVSLHHAVIRWDGQNWTVADLSSRNGTYVNGHRLAAGTSNAKALHLGDELAFAERDELWVLEDEAVPQALLVADDGGTPFPLSEAAMSVLPDEDNALGYMYYEAACWRLEDAAGNVHLLRSGQAISIGERKYRLHLPGAAAETPPADNPIRERTLGEADVEITVSSDEESSAIIANVGGERFAIQARTHLYLLAYLARQRLREAAIADSDHGGWVAVEEVCKQLTLSPELLAVMVYRCRKEFERLGFLEATRIVDRAKKGYLRIGVLAARLTVKTG